MGKRKTYVDRTQALSAQARPANVMPGAAALPCDTTTVGSLERHFKLKLVAPAPPETAVVSDTPVVVLVAMVMQNELCVLMCAAPLVATEVVFAVAADSDAISGKRKRGAKHVKAGTVVARATLADGTVRDLVTPVGGHLLETNDNLLTTPALLATQPGGTGYVAVVYPDTDLPGLSGDRPSSSSSSSSSASSASEHANPNVCFAFLKVRPCTFMLAAHASARVLSHPPHHALHCSVFCQGTCKRGDKCKFEHDEVPSSKRQRTDTGNDKDDNDAAAGQDADEDDKV